jgi:O-antigen/teichoic acid export membrane protein
VAGLVGQVLINNSDVLIVKHFFATAQAGHYAALALIGRIVFFATSSVMTALFPIVAQRQRKGEEHRSLLGLSLAMVGGISGVIVLATAMVPDWIVNILFGADYLPIAPLLWLYALATALYSLANVVVNYRLSAGHGIGTGLVVIGGVLQVAGLWLFHTSLEQVVWIQIYIMAGVLAALLIWDLVLARQGANGEART